MARNATNKLLQKAKKSKSDEFYTQLSDIEMFIATVMTQESATSFFILFLTLRNLVLKK